VPFPQHWNLTLSPFSFFREEEKKLFFRFPFLKGKGLGVTSVFKDAHSFRGACCDSFKHRGKVFTQFPILQSHDADARMYDCKIALRVISGFVERAIQFDGQSRSTTIEIGDEARDDLLTAKMEISAAIVSQMVQRIRSSGVITRRICLASESLVAEIRCPWTIPAGRRRCGIRPNPRPLPFREGEQKGDMLGRFNY
jgi:hypothetical protein